MSLSRLLGGAGWGEVACALSRRASAPLLELGADLWVTVECAAGCAEGALQLGAEAARRAEGALRLRLDDAPPGAAAALHLLAFALASGAHGAPGLVLAGVSHTAAPQLLSLGASGVLGVFALHTYRTRAGNLQVCVASTLSLGVSSALYLTMALSGPTVIAMDEQWFFQPAFVSILQDLVVAHAALGWEAGFSLSAAAPAMAFATVGTAVAIGTVAAAVHPYAIWSRLLCWYSIGLLKGRAQELGSPETARRITAASDLFLLSTLMTLWVGNVDASDAACCGWDVMSKVAICRLLAERGRGAAQAHEPVPEPFPEPPPEPRPGRAE